MAPVRNYSGVSLSPPPLHHLSTVSRMPLASPRSLTPGPMTPTSPAGIRGPQRFQQLPRYSFGQSFVVPAASPRTPRQSFSVPVKVRAAVRNLSTASTTSSTTSTVTQGSSVGRAPSRERKPEREEKDLESALQKLEKERETQIDEEVRKLCERLDSDKDGFISRWDFFNAVQTDENVAKILLPSCDASLTMKCSDTFDNVERIFRHMAGSKGRIAYVDFAAYWQAAQVPKEKLASDLQEIFKIIDAGNTGEISRLALLGAVEASPLVAVRLLPGVNAKDAEQVFTASQELFDAISRGKSRVTLVDFQEHFRKRRPSLTMSRSKAAVQPGNGLLWRSPLY